MMLKTAVKRLRQHTGLSAHNFGKAVGGESHPFTHPSVLNWEKGVGGISEYSRICLLNFAKAYADPERGAVPQEIIDTLEAAQPEMRP